MMEEKEKEVREMKQKLKEVMENYKEKLNEKSNLGKMMEIKKIDLSGKESKERLGMEVEQAELE